MPQTLVSSLSKFSFRSLGDEEFRLGLDNRAPEKETKSINQQEAH